MKLISRLLLAILGISLLVAGPAAAAPGGQPISGNHWETHMTAQNGSGEDGTVTATAVDATHTEIVIQLANGPATPQPAHVHDGTCAQLNPTPHYPLNNVINGMSDTVIPVALDVLTGGGYAVNVHKSAAEVSTYVSCGDTFVNTAGGINPQPGMPATGGAGQGPILLILALLAGALLSTGRRLRRAAR